MPTDPDELKKRLEHDENSWMKVQGQMNNLKGDVYNQIADLFRLVRQQQAQLEKQRDRISKLEGR